MSKKQIQENFYKRLKHLGGVTTSNNPSASLNTSSLIDYTRSNDGIALGIVKENHNYFIKTSSKQGDKLGAEDFAYIGGIENKFKYQHNTLAEAEKNRNFYIKTLNESHSKTFKKIALTEAENIDKAQTNANAENAEKAQGEADKGKGKEPLKDTASEKEIAAVPSEKEIVVDKKQTSPKTVDDTKTGGKVTVVNKQASPKTADVAKVEKTTKIAESTDIKEYGNEHEVSVEDALKNKVAEGTFPPSEDGAAVAPAVPDASSAPASPEAGLPGAEADGGSPDIDAAAAALDDMGAASAEAPAAPAADAGGIGALDGAAVGGEESPADALMGGEGDAAVKDIEKGVGKLTQKIRQATLTPEMSKGFLKSFITSFDEKLDELDHEDKKELANAILKDKSDDEMGIGDELAGGADDAASSGIDAASTSTDDAEEKEIEETINAHLAEMGLSESDVNIEGSAESSDHKPFRDYVKARGYNPDRVDEISLMEMVSLVNGYTNECADPKAADAQGLAEFVTPEVSAKVAESGNGLFENLMKPFGEKIKKNKKAYATEAVIPSINENFGDDEGSEEEEEGGEPAEIVGGDNAEGESDPAASIAVGEEEPVEEPASAEVVSFAPAGEVMAAGAPGAADAAKTVTLDLNNNTISVTMNESVQKKLQMIIKKKIEEQLAGKKSPINESKKSALSAFIDKEVSEAIAKRKENIEKALLRPRK